MSEQQQLDNRWQWDDELWTTDPTTPTDPLDVPEPEHERERGGCFSRETRRLLRWASQKR